MNKIGEITVDEQPRDDTTSDDLIVLIVIGGACIVILAMAVKLCYNYSRNFPGHKERETVEGFNRRAISMKGSRGNRYSVA